MRANRNAVGAPRCAAAAALAGSALLLAPLAAQTPAAPTVTRSPNRTTGVI